MSASTEQQPDTQPGNYYVSAVDGNQSCLMLGPFKNDHAAALAAVKPVRTFCNENEPRSFWYAFGTVRMEDYDKPGSANKYLPELCQSPA